jgi:hypothetical protein
MPDEDPGNRSGIHLTGEDSGWPVAADAEPEPHKDGTGADPWPDAEAYVDGTVTASGEVREVEKTDEGATENFTLTFDGQTTGNIDDDASAATVETALVALSNIAPADIDVSGPDGGPWTITFLEGGAYGDALSLALTADGVGVNEVQSLVATGGTAGDFTLTFDGQTTAAIAYNANAAAVDAALEALSNIPAGGVTCAGGPLPETPVTITFTGALAETDQPAITVTDNVTDGNAVITTTTPGQGGPTFVVATHAEGS